MSGFEALIPAGLGALGSMIGEGVGATGSAIALGASYLPAAVGSILSTTGNAVQGIPTLLASMMGQAATPSSAVSAGPVARVPDSPQLPGPWAEFKLKG